MVSYDRKNSKFIKASPGEYRLVWEELSYFVSCKLPVQFLDFFTKFLAIEVEHKTAHGVESELALSDYWGNPYPLPFLWFNS